MTGDSPFFREVVEKLKADEDFDTLCHVIKTPTSKLSEVFAFAVFGGVAMDRSVSDEEFAKALRLAAEGAWEFDGLCRAMSLRLVIEGRELTSPMRAWISGVLTGQISRPRSKGGPSGVAGGSKRVAVADLVHRACLLGLKRTRNVTSEPTSACDAVVVALSESGYHTTYDAVAKSWAKYAQVWMKEALD